MHDEPVIHVVDDDDAARHSLRFMLECAGFIVRDYDSAVGFLATITPGGVVDPGCIITDVRMPEMNGLELIERLKQKGIAEPVIVITGHADVPMAIQALKGGVEDFIEKPFSDDRIIAVVQSALAKRRASVTSANLEFEVAHRIKSLSRREREVLSGIVEGKANKVIAFDLGISARTVEVYRANVMTKMQVKSLSELVRLTISVEPS